MLGNVWIAALLALFLWWFSTGIILAVVRYVDNARLRREATIATLPLLAVGFWGAWVTAQMPGLTGVYLAFLSALAIWGWIELAFLTGIITGPNKAKLPPNTPEWERFIRAWGTIAYHEMMLVGALIVFGFIALQALNPFGFWTFAILFFARISAKLNLFLGVAKINTEFLPSPLQHLPSHFRHARMNWLFPISITALSFGVACWLERIYAATPTEAVGFALLAALTALALLEHWFMVLPLPDEKLWRWMIPSKTPKKLETTGISEKAHGL